MSSTCSRFKLITSVVPPSVIALCVLCVSLPPISPACLLPVGTLPFVLLCLSQSLLALHLSAPRWVLPSPYNSLPGVSPLRMVSLPPFRACPRALTWRCGVFNCFCHAAYVHCASLTGWAHSLHLLTLPALPFHSPPAPFVYFHARLLSQFLSVWLVS